MKQLTGRNAVAISFATALLLLFCYNPILAQEVDPISWSNTYQSSLSFLENKGQFDKVSRHTQGDIEFAVDNGAEKIYFTKTGITYRLIEKYKNPNRVKGETGKPKYLHTTDYISFKWVGANPDAKLIASEIRSDYTTYSMLSDDRAEHYNITDIKGFDRLTYTDLYPGIDVVYTMHPEGGIKYALVVHPGADPSQVSMQYADGRVLNLEKSGNLIIHSDVANIIEHAPMTYYADNEQLIQSAFRKSRNNISFDLGNYDPSRKIIIDPWVQTPSLGNSSCVWECEVDGNGNVYTIGGELPMRLQKYSSAGALQWTYNTPWDTANSWLGALATDDAGNSYVTSGSVAEIQRVNTGGTADYTNGPGIGSQDEYWSIAFNCDQTGLIVGGTAFGGSFLTGKIYNINTANGSVSSSMEINTGYTSTAILVDEVRAMTSQRNSKYYFLTLAGIGAINQDFSICNNDPIFLRRSDYEFSYKSEFFRPSNGNAGIEAIIANDQFVYTQNGTDVQKRSLVDGTVLGTAAIPGGISTVVGPPIFPPNYQPGNMGITVDDCGNVYVGSGDRVVKYDGNLNLITSTNVPFHVYDVEVNNNGEVIASGGTNDPNTFPRTGYVQAINMAACAPFALICCNPTMCPAGPLCVYDPPITIEVAQPGGVFSGTGITNTSTGIFDPAVAGVGTHTIVYTLPCGSDTILITVNLCPTLDICEEPNGDITASGGTAPYTWESGVPGIDCSGCLGGNCIPIFCPGVPDTTWTLISSTATATPPGTFPLRVTDGSGTVLILSNLTGIQPCSACPTITTNIDSQTDVLCFGEANGAASLSASGGVGSYTYNWMPGNLSGASQTTLSAGTYTVITNDVNGCADTITVTIGEPTALSATTSNTSSTCGNADGTATASPAGGTVPYNYIWPNGATAATATNLSAGTYDVTVADVNNCTVTATATITDLGGPTITNVATTDPNCGASDGSITITATGATQYSIDNGVTFQAGGSFTNLPAGTYDIVVQDGSGCQATSTATLVDQGGVTITNVATTDPNCGASDGSITITATGATQYSIDNGTTFQAGGSFTNLPAGTYDIVVQDGSGCQATSTATLVDQGGVSITSVVTSDPTCGNSDGSITITATGATQYSIDNGTTFQAGNTFTNLPAGSYNIVVEDASGCIDDTLVSLNNLNGPTIDSVVTVDANCGANDGSLTIFAPAAMQFSIDGGTTFQATGTFTGLADGTYNIVIQDVNGCTANTTAIVGVIGAPAITTTPTATTCGLDNGQLLITTTGATQYSINGNPFRVGNSFTGLAAGFYTVTVDFGGGCLVTDTATITANTSPVITLQSTTQAGCGLANGIAVVSVSGGTGTISYLWSNGDPDNTLNNVSAGSYDVTVTDAAGCADTLTVTITNANGPTIDNIDTVSANCGNSDGSITITATGATQYSIDNGTTFQAGGSFTNLPAGTYNIIVEDAGGCSTPGQAVVGTVAGPAATIDPILPTCNGANGSITINGTGGTSPYTYSIDGGVTTQPTNLFNGLSAGTYDVVIIDANGCTDSILGVDFTSGSSPVLDYTVEEDTCLFNRGRIILTVTGGRPPYEYDWDHDTRLNDSIAENLPDGSYFVEVFDIDGCGDSDSIEVACVDVDPLFYIPNAFSPNGDGINDNWEIRVELVEVIQVSVFDRWGEKVYDNNGSKTVSWDGTYKGKTLPPDVFVYQAFIILSDNEKVETSGSLTLIR